MAIDFTLLAKPVQAWSGPLKFLLLLVKVKINLLKAKKWSMNFGLDTGDPNCSPNFKTSSLNFVSTLYDRLKIAFPASVLPYNATPKACSFLGWVCLKVLGLNPITQCKLTIKFWSQAKSIKISKH